MHRFATKASARNFVLARRSISKPRRPRGLPSPSAPGSIIRGGSTSIRRSSSRSTATLLVQSQDLPTTIVDSPTTSAVEQRIARIREQVLSRGDLIQLIEQNDLYSDERRSKPLSKVIEKMRHATTVGALSSDIGQQSGTQNNTI